MKGYFGGKIRICKLQKKEKKRKHCALRVSNFTPWIEYFHLMGIRWLRTLSTESRTAWYSVADPRRKKNTRMNHNPYGIIKSEFIYFSPWKTVSNYHC